MGPIRNAILQIVVSILWAIFEHLRRRLQALVAVRSVRRSPIGSTPHVTFLQQPQTPSTPSTNGVPIMTKPKQTAPKQTVPINEATIDTIAQVFVDLLADDPDGDGNRIARKLVQCKAKMLGAGNQTPATNFTFPKVIESFNLKYIETSFYESHWDIERELESPFPMTQCLSDRLLCYPVLQLTDLCL